MDAYELPDAIEPDYWNICFHPSEHWATRLLIGRFQHVSAFTYVPGFRAWVIYDAQWSGLRLSFFSHQTAMATFIRYTRGCTVLKFTRMSEQIGPLSRFGIFFCVPAIKHLLGVSCFAVTPDGLYRHLIANGAEIVFDERTVRTAATTAGPDAQNRATASAS
jgi:hypothetical protein